MAKIQTIMRRLLLLPGIAARRMLVWLAIRASDWRSFQGLRVGVVVPSRMDSEACYRRIDAALELIVEIVPYRASRMRRDLNGILCFGTGRNAALGAYVPLFGLCLVDPRHVLDPDTDVRAIARTIVHEATHARLHRRAVRAALIGGPRVEAVCERAEQDFDRKAATAAKRLAEEQLEG